MNKNTDHREDLEYIRSVFESDGISAPDSLSEENIMAMLPDQDKMPEQLGKDSAPESGSDQFRQPVTVRKKASAGSLRKWTAAAACLLIALFGSMQVYRSVTAPPDTVTDDGTLYTFKNKSEIEHLIGSLEPAYNRDYATGDGLELLEDSDMASEESSAAPDAGISKTSGSGHSETYLQVDGVDEADIVKTDGKYIYYVSSTREVVILEADEGKTRQLSRIGSEGMENYVHDIFLKGDTLVTVGHVYDGEDSYTGVVTYDISDRSHPEMITSFRQTGDIVSSRMVGSYVYLVTTEYVFRGGRTVPKCTVDGEFREMNADSICCVPEPGQPSYVILSAMDISSGKDAKCRTRAIFGASDDIYCNDHNLYAAVNEWDSKAGANYTRIARARLDGLNVKFDASAKVRGNINNQFSMDEKDGYFRIATTGIRDGMDVNNLFILDSSLKETGKVTGFARNESIRAVRYFGNKAYVITYEQIDPLFIIDLSDPSHPVIEGEVMIDGFSTLLVPAGEGRLLGIGHATGDNGYGGEYAAGLKLALFDISDPSHPKVLDSKEFKDMDSPAQITHKALTVNAEDGWYAVPYSIYHYDDQISVAEEDSIGAEISEDTIAPETEISEPGFESGVLVFGAGDSLTVYDQHRLGSSNLTRSVYIGDYIYALDDEGEVSSFRFSK